MLSATSVLSSPDSNLLIFTCTNHKRLCHPRAPVPTLPSARWGGCAPLLCTTPSLSQDSCCHSLFRAGRLLSSREDSKSSARNNQPIFSHPKVLRPITHRVDRTSVQSSISSYLTYFASHLHFLSSFTLPPRLPSHYFIVTSLPSISSYLRKTTLNDARPQRIDPTA
jgi:hypothetical protein